MSWMRTPEGDELLGVIRGLVHGTVHPSQEDRTIEIVVTTLMIILSDPKYYNHLNVVIDLQSRIIQLERALAAYQGRMANPPRPAAKKVTAKKGVAKPTVRKVAKKPPLPYNVKQFKRGASGH